MIMFKHPGRLGASVAAILMAASLAACVNSNQAISAIKAICGGLAIGSQIAIQVTNSSNHTTTQTVQTIGTDINTSCTTILAGAQGVIDNITAAGGTATVSVTTQTPAGARSRATAMFYRVNGQVRGRWVIPPQGGVLGSLSHLF